MSRPHPNPNPSSAMAAQTTVQFLSNVLSQRGPSELPYNEEDKWLIRQNLVNLFQDFPSLQVKTASFTHNNGTTVNLLQAEGTIPMYYQNVMYNIPVIIWLLETFPRQPPCVYVAPTRDMVIKRNHNHVNASGLVSVPYFQSWVYPTSNLVDLVRDMSQVFSRDPPLYTKQAPRIQSGSSTSFSRLSSASSTNSGSEVSSNPPPPITNLTGRFFPPYGRIVQPSPPPKPHTEEPAEVFKRNTITKLLEMMHKDITVMRKARLEEMDTLFSTQATLKGREEQLDLGLRDMIEEKEGLERSLQIMLTNSDVLETWVERNAEKASFEIDIDSVFKPADKLSEQMLESSAADLAIEDMIYALEQAVQKGVIPFDAYLRQIRALSREQFFHRAMAAKVRAAQMQAHVASMSSRVSHYAM